MNTKDRDIPVATYLDKLQNEFLICDFRRKVYPSPVDKRYYKKVMSYKKDKIEDISGKNKLPNIFNDSELLKKLRKEIYNEENQPVFTLNENDIVNYYGEGNSFRIISKNKIGVLKNVSIKDNVGEIHISDSEVENIMLQNISRIL